MDPDLIYEYAVVPEHPATEAIICWIDDNPGSAAAMRLAYGPGLASTEGATETTMTHGAEVLRLYTVRLGSLTPETTYEAEIQLADGTPVKALAPIRTLPASMAGKSVRYAWVSDQHVGPPGGEESPTVMHDDAWMQPIADVEPDVLLVGGDLISYSDSRSATRTQAWKRYFREYVSRMHSAAGRLVPMLITPGNHDVSNHNWTGNPETESVNPDTGYVKWLNLTPHQVEPVGENYGSIKIAGHTQLLVLDTHSAFAEDVGPWMESVIDDDLPLCLPIHHMPLLPGGQRNDWQEAEAQARLRDHYGPVFAAHRNIKVTLCGHIHIRKLSVPYTVSPVAPQASHFELADGAGYLHEQAGGVVEIGDGWRMDRTPWDRWWLQHANRDHNQFFVLDVSEDDLVVSLYATTGGESPSIEPEPVQVLEFSLAPAQVPAPPQGLVASQQGAGYIASWEPSEWATGYNVYGRSGGQWELLQTVYIESAYSTSEQPDEIAISAFNELGEGDLSDAARLLTPATESALAYRAGGENFVVADAVIHAEGASTEVQALVLHVDDESRTLWERES